MIQPVVNKQTIDRPGRQRPLFAVVGPSGVGKTSLSLRIAQLITRAVFAPNVLLIDVDIYNRGLTAQLEQVPEIQNRCWQSVYLHDVIVGKNITKLKPLEISGLFPGEDRRLSQEGGLFLCPSIRKGAMNPFISSSNTEMSEVKMSEVKNLLHEAINSAAESCNAEAIVADTAPIAEPLGAVLASLADVIVLIGSPAKSAPVTEEHLERLKEFETISHDIPVVRVSNQIPIGEKGSNRGKNNCLVISDLNFLKVCQHNESADSVADNIEFNKCIIDLLSRCFASLADGLTPPWFASLPSDWRTLIINFGESKHGITSYFRKRAVLELAIGIPSGSCLFLSVFVCESYGISNPVTLIFSVVGFCFLILSVGLLLRSFIQGRVCHTISAHLQRKDIPWILSKLRNKHGAQYRLSVKIW
jgi:cellulose biosynthesis protein BcsQ